jgi:hypothetical protein
MAADSRHRGFQALQTPGGKTSARSHPPLHGGQRDHLELCSLAHNETVLRNTTPGLVGLASHTPHSGALQPGRGE